MRLHNPLRGWLFRQLASRRGMQLRRAFAERWRRVRRSPHVVSAFLELDDPYSWLLASYLPELAQHYRVRLDLYLVESPGGALRPAPELYHEYALADCRRLAKELGVPFLDRSGTPPVEYRRRLLDALASREDAPDFFELAFEAIKAYWRGDGEAVARRSDHGGSAANTNAMLARNGRQLRAWGYYQAASLHYGGEWYPGIDRLHYLVSRLDALGAASQPGLAPRIASVAQVMQLNLPVSPPVSATALPPLELFYSFRSPYSWLALQRTREIAAAFGVPLAFRPVLPMVMRGLPVPPAKLRYIAFDAGREARTHRVPFGKFRDPVGAGVENCMAVLALAREQDCEYEFLFHAGKAIWSEGVDVAAARGLRRVTDKAGLAWPEVEAALDRDDWRQEADLNRELLMAAGCWGVPTIRIGDWVTWGQDRDWLVALQLEERCDGGDGILI